MSLVPLGAFADDTPAEPPADPAAAAEGLKEAPQGEPGPEGGAPGDATPGTDPAAGEEGSLPDSGETGGSKPGEPTGENPPADTVDEGDREGDPAADPAQEPSDKPASDAEDAANTADEGESESESAKAGEDAEKASDDAKKPGDSKPADEKDKASKKDDKQKGAEPKEEAPSLAALAQSGLEALATIPTELEVGDYFLYPSDEGLDVLYRVTSEDTVELGAHGAQPVVNRPEVPNEYGELVKQSFSTIDTSFNGTLTVPDTVEYGSKTYTVTTIATGAFQEFGLGPIYYSLGKIVLPPTVTRINDYAFHKCPLQGGVGFTSESGLLYIGSNVFYGSQIESFDLPSTVVYLGTGIFNGARALQSFTFPEESRIVSIPAMMFADTGLTRLDIPPYIASIGDYAFGGSMLTEFVVPKTVKTIGTGILRNCVYLSYSTFEDGSPITEIPAFTYAGCTNLSSYEFPAFISSIEQRSFSGSGLVRVAVPKTLTYLGDYAFSGCKKLAGFEFEDGHGLMQVNAGLFSGCTALASIALPGNIRQIGASAFENCDNLSTIEIPAKCTVLGALAFQDMDKLKSVVFLGDEQALELQTSTFYNTFEIESLVFMGKKTKKTVVRASAPTVYYTVTFYASKSDVGKAEPLGRFCVPANSIPSQTTKTDAFAGEMLSEPAGTHWVCEDGFSLDAEMVDSFYVYAEPVAATLQAGDTFTADTVEKATVTYTVVEPSVDGEPGVVSVGRTDAGARASAIETGTTGAITLPDQVTGPDANAYAVTSIEPYAFANCTKFATLRIPGTVTSIGSHAFFRCSSLRNIYFDSDADKIVDDGIFSGCSKIKLVVFGGKKANVSFGSSSPDVYYTVFYYDNKHDLDIGNIDEKAVVHERALLGALKEGELRSGTIPERKIGFVFEYEPGFGADIPLVDSCWVYQDGIGLQVTIRVQNGNVRQTPCWFKILEPAVDGKPGVVQVGLNDDGITAVSQAVRGVPVIPEYIADADGNTYHVEGVSDYAFGSSDPYLSCQGIVSVSLPGSVKHIGEGAFYSCKGLKSMIMPTGLTSMGRAAFAECEGLETLTLHTAPKLAEIPAEAFADCWNLGNVVLPAGTTTIGDGAFADCYRSLLVNEVPREYGLKSVDFSRAKGLKSIGTGAFSGDAITSFGNLVLPEGFVSVGDYAFYSYPGIRGITSVEFPSTIRYVGRSAFMYSRLTRITFNGDARGVRFGPEAFYLYEGDGEGQSPGALRRVEFKGKKSSTIDAVIDSGSRLPGADRDNDKRRIWRYYYTVATYENQADLEAGRPINTFFAVEDEVPSTSTNANLKLPRGVTWNAEPGYNADEQISDSFWLVKVKDIALATASGVESEYYYTGSAIKPVPTLTMPDGTVLTEGVDYVFDARHGRYADGYSNNVAMGTARIHLRGIGDYGGTKIVPFTILQWFDSSAAFQDVKLSPPLFVYDGTPKTPAVEVSAFVKGRTLSVREGIDYRISYLGNTDAGTATAVVTGMGVFSASTIAHFTIVPRDISDSYQNDMRVSVDATGSVTVSYSLVNPVTGKPLVKGVDYDERVFSMGVFGSGQVIIYGKGNYTGAIAKTFGVSGEGTGGGDGGNGGGSGGGNGSETGGGGGDQDGTGDARTSGTGASASQGDASTMAHVTSSPMFGGAHATQVSGYAGSEIGGGAAFSDEGGEGGPRYHLYELAGEPDIAVETDNVPVPWWLIFIVVTCFILIGIVRKSAEHVDDKRPPDGGLDRKWHRR